MWPDIDEPPPSQWPPAIALLILGVIILWKISK